MMDLMSFAFSSLKMDATSWARMGMRREKMSVPRFLGSVGWNDIGFTRSAPAARDKSLDLTVNVVYIQRNL